MPSDGRRVRARLAGAALVLALVLAPASVAGLRQDTLPASIADRDFWALIAKISEPDGFFRSNSGSPDNLLSNENTISTMAAALAERVKPGGVYLGVGPEQNFTYIAAMRPKIAFVTDIRRGNLHLHLLYKAVFELSADRRDFVARLFSRKQPAGLDAKASAAELMDAYLRAEAEDAAGYQSNLAAITDHLIKKRTLPLDADDRAGLDYVYRHFHQFGPAINYVSSVRGSTGSAASYAALQSVRDRLSGGERTFLATEDSFQRVKALQHKNLIVPVVGNFAGPKAIRAIGAYLKQHGAVVTAFYVSNVEDYLNRQGVWPVFCANVAALPLDAASLFIRPNNTGRFDAMAVEAAACRGAA
jgi:hypothetical protein